VISEAGKHDFEPEFVAKQFDTENANPFSVLVLGDKKEVYLPSNWSNISQNEILARMFLSLTTSANYNPILKSKPYDWTLKLDANQTSFLKGWYSCLNNIPTFSKNLQKDFKRGVLFGLHLMLEKEKISELVKQDKTGDVNILLLGNAWGVKYQVEKNMIDQLKHFTRLRKPSGSIMSWLLSSEEVKDKLGLRNPIDNALLSDNEQEDLKARYKIPLDLINIIGERKIEDVKNPEEELASIRRWLQEIKELQRKLKPLKSICDEIVRKRGKFVFQNKKNKKLLAEKRPVKDLISNIKSDPQWGNIMNPSYAYSNGGTWLEISLDLTPENISLARQMIFDYGQQYQVNSLKLAELNNYFSSLLGAGV